MIERLLYGRSLPALYEVELSAGRGSEEPLVFFADQLEGLGDSREESVYLAVRHKAEEEAIDIDYSLKLLRPGEVRQFLRPRVWHALGKTAEERLVKLMPVDMGQLARNHLVTLRNLETTHES